MRLKNTALRLLLTVIVLVVIAVALMWLLSFPALAPNSGQTQNNNQSATDEGQTFPVQTPAAIDDAKVTAKSYLVYDMHSNSVLASRSPKTAVSIASLTKLLTGYLVNAYGSPEDIVTIKPGYVLNINPVLGVKPGDKIKVDDLFNSMMVGSANDAALTLGYYLEEKLHKPIAEIMNEEARKLGMNDSHFSTPVGFDSDTNYSTASDMQLLVRKTTFNPAFITIDRLFGYSFTSENGEAYSVTATNKLLTKYPEIHAIKTGYTDDANGAMIVSIQTSGTEFVIILLGSENREQDAIEIYQAVLKKYFPK